MNLNLSPEHVSLAFQHLTFKVPYSKLPKELLELNLSDWAELAGLLEMLELEQKMSVVH